MKVGIIPPGLKKQIKSNVERYALHGVITAIVRDQIEHSVNRLARAASLTGE